VLIKDYDLDIQYHPGKANVVVDALSRKGQANMAITILMPQELCWEMEQLHLGIVYHAEVVTMESNLPWSKKLEKGN